MTAVKLLTSGSEHKIGLGGVELSGAQKTLLKRTAHDDRKLLVPEIARSLEGGPRAMCIKFEELHVNKIVTAASKRQIENSLLSVDPKNSGLECSILRAMDCMDLGNKQNNDDIDVTDIEVERWIMCYN